MKPPLGNTCIMCQNWQVVNISIPFWSYLWKGNNWEDSWSARPFELNTYKRLMCDSGRSGLESLMLFSLMTSLMTCSLLKSAYGIEPNCRHSHRATPKDLEHNRYQTTVIWIGSTKNCVSLITIVYDYGISSIQRIDKILWAIITMTVSLAINVCSTDRLTKRLLSHKWKM